MEEGKHTGVRACAGDPASRRRRRAACSVGQAERRARPPRAASAAGLPAAPLQAVCVPVCRRLSGADSALSCAATVVLLPMGECLVL